MPSKLPQLPPGYSLRSYGPEALRDRYGYKDVPRDYVNTGAVDRPNIGTPVQYMARKLQRFAAPNPVGHPLPGGGTC